MALGDDPNIIYILGAERLPRQNLIGCRRVNPSTLLKYSETTALDPYAMSGRASMALLEELIATAQIIGRAG